MLVGLLVIAGALAIPIDRSNGSESHQTARRSSASTLQTGASRVEILGPPFEGAAGEEDAAYDEAARSAWAFLTRHRSDETGLVRATSSYDHITTWDIGSLLAGVHAGGELGLTSRSAAEAWLGDILETLATVELYDGVAFNKLYHSRTGRMIGYGDRPSSTGNGWSALDPGRLLTWLRIVAEEHPDLEDRVRRVVDRLDFDRLLADGYLQGETVGPRGRSVYPEGKVGYEQYAAQGFRLWGHRAPKALDLHLNTRPVVVLGQTILGDVRGGERLTSEPFILMGMETGWTPPFREPAWRMLAVQEARYRETGLLTMLSEDALPEPPHYFYYYSVYTDGEPFVVRAHGPVGASAPRWVSAKAAYGWHALLPTEYTWRVLRAVAPARSSEGWASGVYEESGESTKTQNVNTAAVILEAALYRQRGRPFLSGSSDSR